MSNLFAEYDPHSHGEPLLDLELRRAEPGDIESLAQLSSARDGSGLEASIERFERELGTPGDSQLWIAQREDRRLAFARLSLLARPADCAPNHQPAGWYLGGVIVARAWRRRGIARSLTQLRLDFLATRAREVFYVVNATNRASIDLHTQFGFEEVTRDFHAPGVRFTGGVGILFRLDLCRAESR